MPQIRISKNGPWPRWKLTIRGSLNVYRAFISSIALLVLLFVFQGWRVVQSIQRGTNTLVLIATMLVADALVVWAQMPFWKRARAYFRERRTRREEAR